MVSSGSTAVEAKGWSGIVRGSIRTCHRWYGGTAINSAAMTSPAHPEDEGRCSTCRYFPNPTGARADAWPLSDQVFEAPSARPPSPRPLRAVNRFHLPWSLARKCGSECRLATSQPFTVFSPMETPAVRCVITSVHWSSQGDFRCSLRY